MGRRKKIVDSNQLLFDFDYIEQDLFLEGDIRNIRKMLPSLYDHQIEDVARAEKRYLEGKGYLLTNGTGVGKTFCGLGLAKRFYEKGKKDILIVVPTDKKCTDWIKDGFRVDLVVSKLNGTQDSGHEVTVTTYANFYQNEILAKRHFDLIIYDESHYLNQNAAGNGTSSLARHRYVANLPSEARNKAVDFVGQKPERLDNEDYYAHKERREKWELEVVKKTIEIVDKTKVLFLSATPFAYHKSITYADGTLFEIDERIVPKSDTSYGYNEATGFEKFLVENFGYSMRYNKVTKPGPEVNLDLLERNFFESNFEKGIMSTRVLQLDKDYSRQFITLDSDLGEILDEGMNIFNVDDNHKKYPNLKEVSKRQWNYNNVNQLLECIKAKHCVDRIKKHLELGRKVVVFHTYNNSVISHPFRFEARNLLLTGEEYLYNRLSDEIKQFNREYFKYVNLDLSGLKNPREAITSEFAYAKEFNGIVPKNKRSQYLDSFNQDYSTTDILIVQTKAGREGISLHDKTGEHQRVLINLGLPTAPTQAIQEEGRIYRSGLKSNAIYEYMTLQTDFERYAFATKIAERSKTAENLAMGNLARDLERAFKDGYIASSYIEPNLEQGVGGKEEDRAMLTITPYEKSKTYYFMKQKKNSKNKAKEGIDYFATPEPLGYMMCQWINNDDPDAIIDESKAPKWLEPSAGHGAIARFFPKNTKNVFVEQSNYLASQVAINCFGEVKIHSFEGYHIMNKFHYILMNPPFGSNGKTAMEHLEKACVHLANHNATLLAIIPNGSSMNKRFEQFCNDKEKFKYLSYTGEIILPNVTFERAGTVVGCRIVRIQKNFMMPKIDYFKSIDLSYIQDINEFFNEIESINFKSPLPGDSINLDF